MGWTPQGSKVVGSGPQVRAEIDASSDDGNAVSADADDDDEISDNCVT